MSITVIASSDRHADFESHEVETHTAYIMASKVNGKYALYVDGAPAVEFGPRYILTREEAEEKARQALTLLELEDLAHVEQLAAKAVPATEYSTGALLAAMRELYVKGYIDAKQGK